MAFGARSLDYLPLPDKTYDSFSRGSFLHRDTELHSQGDYDPHKSSPLTDLILSRFMIAPVEIPGQFCMSIKQSSQAPRLMDFAKGTTTLAFIYNGGGVVAVDSRASMGSFISEKNTKKAILINKRFVGTLAGGAADCQYWLRVLNRQCRLFELRNGEPISVAAASNLLTNALFQYKGYGLSTGIMLCGYDNKGPQLYFHDETGLRLKGKLFSIGSGMTYAYGILDSEFNEDMTKMQAIELGRKAIYHATVRDGGSGNTVTVYHITKDGPECMIFQQDIHDVHLEYSKTKGKTPNEL